MSLIAKSPPRPRIDLDALRLGNSLPSIAGAVVKLRRAGREWKGCCPFHQDRTPSFTIYSGGRRFLCFGCGASGDVFDFLMRLHGVGLRDAAAMLAGGDVPTIEVAPLPDIANDDANDRLEEVRSIWRNAVPAPGTLADTYLRSRGLDLPIPESIRFSSLRYGKSGAEHPVLVAAVAGPDDRLCGIQRTFLAPDGRGKADVPKPKLSLGKVRGGAIRLAPVAGKLIVTEGLEDGLTLQQELGLAVWVAAGSSMLPSMAFPPIVRSVAIGGDNDAAGRSAADKAARAFSARGLEARVFFPVGAKDFNDELRGVCA
jgi:DNA primase